MRHGLGKQIWPNGKVYEGFWLNDKRVEYLESTEIDKFSNSK